MKSFNQLLNQHIQRAGVSDAELARTIGVSRQTIFRWREGQTSRPRQREDILAIAQKLRLTVEEQDILLLAAGFQPQQGDIEPYSLTPPSIAIETEDPQPHIIEQHDPGAVSNQTNRTSKIQPLRFMTAWGVAILAALLIWSLVWTINYSVFDKNALRSTTATPAALTISSSPTITPAAAGETVIMVAHFANYASSQTGYNIAGRLTEALERERGELGLAQTRIAVWPDIVAERDQALQAGRAISATLVIYGEYDAGRVLVKFASPANQTIFAHPALQRDVLDIQELSATINNDLPQQVRSLALMALGQIYLGQNKAGQARPLLTQARNNLQRASITGDQSWALINFFLGAAYHHSDPPALDEAIEAYSEAITAWPQMISSRLNRIAAYEARNQSGDLALALADADTVVAAVPEWGLAYNNRASIRLRLGGSENLSLALSDLEKAISLEPKLAEAYLNRAYAYLGQGQSMAAALTDLEQALELRPDYSLAFNLLCWGYAVEGQPETALPYCQQAIAVEPGNPQFQDSRGLAYALLGNFEAAILDFETYVAWLEEVQPGLAWRQEATRRRNWIEILKAGENPFTPALLADLRQELGQ